MMLLKDTCPSMSLTSLEEFNLLRLAWLGFLKSLRRDPDLVFGDLMDLVSSVDLSVDSVSGDFGESNSADFREVLSPDLSFRGMKGDADGVLIFLKILKDLLSFG